MKSILRIDKKMIFVNRYLYLLIHIFLLLALSLLTFAESDLPGSNLIKTRFNLTNQFGEKVSETNYLGKYQLIFFGFTSCPKICPTALARMTSTLKLLGSARSLINPIFISIDPKRDSPQRLQEYLANFDPQLIGLTGDQEEVDAVSQSFRAYYNQIKTQDSYTFDHSSIIYLMDKEGNYLNHFTSNLSDQEMTNLIIKEINE